MNNVPKVWVWVIIIDNDKVLLWRRKNAHWEWTWQFAWGHLEFKEWFIECTKREALEETNLEIENISFVTTTNDFFEKENKHYITIFMKGYVSWWELKNMEPNKCEFWKWFKWNELPDPLMLPIINLLKLDINPIKST